MWGSDLSGSQQGAGGVGGLIKVAYYGAATTNCFVAYDGNGNVSALINAADGTTLANYEYGPFGEVIRATGPMAKVNPFRFSTKYQDDETDFLYYGYRYYNPSTGRWLSRDPAQEAQGGPNLYGFADNDPIDNADELGLLVGNVTVSPWAPYVRNGFQKGYWTRYARGWLVGLTWTPPTSGAWANACSCKPCQKVIWIQDVSYGRGPFQTDWGDADYAKYGYAWDCTKSGSVGAAMFDQPDQHGNFLSLFTSPYIFFARSKAKCVAGPDAGKIYATVLWGFTWTYDVTPKGLGPITY